MSKLIRALAATTALFAGVLATPAFAVDGYFVLWQVEMDIEWDYLTEGHLGDFDDDGEMEFVAGDGDGNLQIRDAMTGVLEGEFNGQSVGGIAVVDLDYDGTPEIIADVGYWRYVIDFGSLPM